MPPQPPLRRPGGTGTPPGGPEAGGGREPGDNPNEPVDIASLLSGLPPEKIEQMLQLIQQMGLSGGREVTQHGRRERREQSEEQSKYYQVGEEGVAGKILEGVSLNLIQNETVREGLDKLIRKMNEKGSNAGPEDLNDWLGGLRDIEHGAGVSSQDVAIIEKLITNMASLSTSLSLNRDELGGISLSLTGPEIKGILSGIKGARETLEGWVSEIERTNFNSEEDTNREFFRKYSAAIGWLPILASKYYVNTPKEDVDELIREFRARIHIHNMKWAIETDDWKMLQPIANAMGTTTLFEGFKIKHVSTAFNLYQRFFERYRFAYGKVKNSAVQGVALWRINPEIVSKIKSEVRAELIANKTLYGIDTVEEAERVSNIGLNLFSASMREGVHVARGQIARQEMEVSKELESEGYRKLVKEPAYQSDPNEMLANLYNPLQFGLEKWGKFGKPQLEIVNKILLFMGKGDMDVGRQKFNNMIAIVDYLSSGWRIENISQAIDQRLEYYGITDPVQRKKIVDSLCTGLFLQWKNPFREDADPEKRATNIKEGKDRLRIAAVYRPMELIKAYAVTIDKDGKHYTTGDVQDEFQQMLDRGEFKTSSGYRINNYVRLEEIMGRYIYPIYQQAMNRGWDKIHGIDIANPTDAEDRALIQRVIDTVNGQDFNEQFKLKTVEELQALYKKMQDFLLKDKTIDDLATNNRHYHLYDRALYLDDAPLGMLEEEVGTDIIPISKKFFTTEGGRRDPYARMWGDTAASRAVLDAGWNAMISRNPEELMKNLTEAMGAQTGYAGRPPYLKFLFSISAGWLQLARADTVWQLIGANNKVPWATSEFERLFGLGAPSLGVNELKGLYEKMKSVLGGMETEPGGKDLDKRVIESLGIQSYKVILIGLRGVALIVILAMLQEVLKNMEKDEE